MLLASASIPAVFPPVMLDVTVDGVRHQEMHVDGGTVAQAFLYPPSFSLRSAAARAGVNEKTLRASRKRTAYVIRNGRFTRPEETVKLQTIAIAKEALSTMITSSGVNDTYRMYLLARRDGVDFNLASIGDDFDVPYKGPFDKDYMQSLFAYGYQRVAVVIRGRRLRPVTSIRLAAALKVVSRGATLNGPLIIIIWETIMSGIFRALKYSVMTLVAAALLFAAASPSYADTGSVRALRSPERGSLSVLVVARAHCILLTEPIR